MSQELWQHQREAISMLQYESARALFWEPRMGKTRAIVEDMRSLAIAKQVHRFLVVAPKNVAVCRVWQDEMRGRLPVPVLEVFDGSLQQRAQRIADLPKSAPYWNVVLTNYDALPDLLPVLLQWKPEYLVLDESHFVKNPAAKRSKAAHKIAAVAQYRRILSGTPDPRNYADYFSQYKVLDSSVFGEKVTAFRNRYCIMHPRFFSKVIGYRNLEELKEKIWLRADIRFRKDCLDMPAVQEIVRRVTLPESAHKLYVDIRREGVMEWRGKTIEVPHILAQITRLQQLTAGFLNGEQVHSAKVDAVLAELEETLAAWQKAVVFTRFRDELEAIVATIKATYDVSVHSLHGGTPTSQRYGMVEYFNKQPGPQVFVAQIQSGGTGISLRSADLAIYTSPVFDYADFAQSKERIWKPDIDKVLSYVYLVCPNTIDVEILRALRNKQSVSQALLAEGYERMVSFARDLDW